MNTNLRPSWKASGNGGSWRDGGWVLLAAALLLLDASVTFENVWPTPRVWWAGGVSIELAVCVLVIAVVIWRGRQPVSRKAIAWLSVAWTALVVGRYADVTAPALYGREIN